MAKQDQYELEYITVPKKMYMDSRLSRLQLVLVAFIYSYSGEEFYFTSHQLAKQFNGSVDGIDKAVKRLEEYGYIKRERKGRTYGNGTYRLIHKLYRFETRTVPQYGMGKEPTVREGGTGGYQSTVGYRTGGRTKDNIKDNIKERGSNELRPNMKPVQLGEFINKSINNKP